MLDDLIKCIEILKERMRIHEERVRAHEACTRAALVDPLLHALGWDVSDPGMVRPEYKIDTGGKPHFVDYALLNNDGAPFAIIEAKKLGTLLTRDHTQIVNYATISGVHFAGLTDGDNWAIYYNFKRVAWEDKKILEISVAELPSPKCALKLLLLWRYNFASDDPVSANRPVFDVSSKPEKIVTKSEQEVKTPKKEQSWVQLAKYTPKPGAICPEEIKFWDDSTHQLASWRDVLFLIVKKLHSEELLTAADCPIQRGKNTYIVNTAPVHPTNRPFVGGGEIPGAGLFVNLNLSSKAIVVLSRKMLTDFNGNPNDVKLRLRK